MVLAGLAQIFSPRSAEFSRADAANFWGGHLGGPTIVWGDRSTPTDVPLGTTRVLRQSRSQVDPGAALASTPDRLAQAIVGPPRWPPQKLGASTSENSADGGKTCAWAGQNGAYLTHLFSSRAWPFKAKRGSSVAFLPGPFEPPTPKTQQNALSTATQPVKIDPAPGNDFKGLLSCGERVLLFLFAAWPGWPSPDPKLRKPNRTRSPQLCSPFKAPQPRRRLRRAAQLRRAGSVGFFRALAWPAKLKLQPPKKPTEPALRSRAAR